MGLLVDGARRAWARLVSRLIVVLALFLSVVTLTGRAEAYPWMLRHHDSGCANCHADPSGGGLLTTHGRAAGDLLLRMPYGPRPEEASRSAGFLLGAVKLPNGVLLGGDVREAALYVKPAGQPATTDVFLMQGDVTAQATVSRMRANASLGFAQKGALPTALTRGAKDNLVSRVHWLGVDLGDEKQFLVRAGRMNLPFGLRSVEHVAWTRSFTRTDANQSQQDGAAFAWNLDAWRGEVMAIAGNFQERPDAFRERGYSGYVEWDPVRNFTVGASSLITHASRGLDPNGVPLTADLIRQAHGVFLRYVPVTPLVLSMESDFLYDSQPASAAVGAINGAGLVNQIQADFEPIQGLHFVAIGELLDRKSDLASATGGTQPWLRGWGVVNWFFAPHADVRVDAIYESDAQGGQRIGITTLLGQIHAYL